jgi:hypothetical protein
MLLPCAQFSNQWANCHLPNSQLHTNQHSLTNDWCFLGTMPIFTILEVTYLFRSQCIPTKTLWPRKSFGLIQGYITFFIF